MITVLVFDEKSVTTLKKKFQLKFNLQMISSRRKENLKNVSYFNNKILISENR